MLFAADFSHAQALWMVAALIVAMPFGLWLYSWAAKKWTEEKVSGVLKAIGAGCIVLLLLTVGVVFLVLTIRDISSESIAKQLAPAFEPHLREYSEGLRERLGAEQLARTPFVLANPGPNTAGGSGSGSANGPEPPNPKSDLMIPGKAVVLNESTGKIHLLIFGSLKPELRASHPTEVRTIIWVHFKDNVVGRYSNGRDAIREDCRVTVIDLAKSTVLRGLDFEGGSPSETISSSRPFDRPRGASPAEDVWRYLNARLKLP
jgi:hypothetical protein